MTSVSRHDGWSGHHCIYSSYRGQGRNSFYQHVENFPSGVLSNKGSHRQSHHTPNIILLSTNPFKSLQFGNFTK